ncbi:O-fucosyltransferase 16-like isoform X1 [Zingiber officinale]|uniref:O-fucosyltransferase 16-like isoform X1 n=1 Tax=Zingiber officinale TaxID=94328 RepID=UPI001C4C03FC|nr:O-fucosyltransferase 16-like isoform X1 [Zingiber officinale]
MPPPRRRHPRGRCQIVGASDVSALSFSTLILLIFLSFLSYLAPPLLDHPPLPGTQRRRLADPPSHLTTGAVNEQTSRVPRVDGRVKNDLWRSKRSRFYVGCSNASNKFAAETVTHRDRYLMIGTSGGLNQQRTGIIDAVVAARILNATLIVPKLDQRSFWKDASNFGDIFDADWFISLLSKDVKIIKELPKKAGKYFRSPYTMRVPRKCTPRCYQNRVLPVLMKKHVVQLTKFDYRLANKLETEMQKLRCRVNYHALRFTNSIQEMGEKLIRRMKGKGNQFIALHLRFEPDMLAFSGCYYGGGEKEMRELGAIRRRWKTLHRSNPDKARRQGRCPLTPEEVGLMLRALGYGTDAHIYVASGEIYGGDESLAPLKTLFPNFHSKDTLASKEELEPFSMFSSRMAALDFIVCDGSDAFVANNNGNMARILAGKRRYFGHKRTIRPNAKKLYSLFLNRSNISWDEFASKVRTHQRGYMGEPKEVRPGRGEFHENPSTCICDAAESLNQINPNNQHRKGKPTSDDFPEEPDGSERDYGEYTSLSKSSSNDTEMDYDSFTRTEDSEIDDILSD